MPKFFDDLKGKAQSALNATPLGAYVPGHDQQSGVQPTSTSQGGGRSHTLGALQHQIRTLQLQYGAGGSKDLRQLQLVITGQKGVVLDLEKQAQDAKALSKEFYIWGQDEDSDIKDVSDRLAYLQYVQGSLAAALASSLDAARAPLKALRDAESQLQPKRNLRTGYELQISRLKNEAKPGTEQKLKEVEILLKKAEIEDEPLEKEIDLLKRKAIVENETQKWQALREYGEKLVLLSQACHPLIEALPTVPPTTERPYGGAASTAATRAALQRSLDNYKPGNITLLPLPSGAERESRSFGETHASELSRISSVADHQHPTPRSPPRTPPGHDLPPQPTAITPAAILSHPSEEIISSPASSTPINPSELNNAPTPIPSTSPDVTPATTSAEPLSAVSSGSVPTSGPTVAETGVPLVGGKEGPGPASGSLARGRQSTQSIETASGLLGPGYGEAAPSYGGEKVRKFGLNDPGPSEKYESAEEEKKRLEREDRERLLHSDTLPNHVSSLSVAASTTHESAEEEKRRLEREERERVLRDGGSGGSGENSPPLDADNGDGSVPPPYTEPR